MNEAVLMRENIPANSSLDDIMISDRTVIRVNTFAGAGTILLIHHFEIADQGLTF